MIAGRTGVAGAVLVAGLVMAPTAALAAAPGATSLRSTLADPIETGFVEVNSGTSGTLEGNFDANGYANRSGVDSTRRQSIADALTQSGFVAGYGREWYWPRRSDWLGELVMVFAKQSGAAAVASSSKLNYLRDSGFQSMVDVRLNSGAYGLTEVTTGFHWTVVVFTIGNDLYTVVRGSDTDFMTPQGLAQSQKEYSLAQAGTSVSGEPNPMAGLVQYLPPLAIGAFIGMLLVAALVCAVVFITFAPRQKPPVPTDTVPKP